jgi:hypothetical protein
MAETEKMQELGHEEKGREKREPEQESTARWLPSFLDAPARDAAPYLEMKRPPFGSKISNVPVSSVRPTVGNPFSQDSNEKRRNGNIPRIDPARPTAEAGWCCAPRRLGGPLPSDEVDGALKLPRWYARASNWPNGEYPAGRVHKDPKMIGALSQRPCRQGLWVQESSAGDQKFFDFQEQGQQVT